jgi:segregation and condensation protein B
MELEKKIEAVLFYKAEPERIGALAKTLKSTPAEIESAITALSKRLESSGLRVIRHDDTVELRTAPELSELIDTLRKEELVRDLGRAGAETLSIVLYRGPISRAEIDYIRGVNSSYILRNLYIRGLIERVEVKGKERSIYYGPTLDLLGFLGITETSQLPQYNEVRAELEAYGSDAETDAPLDA